MRLKEKIITIRAQYLLCGAQLCDKNVNKKPKEKERKKNTKFEEKKN